MSYLQHLVMISYYQLSSIYSTVLVIYLQYIVVTYNHQLSSVDCSFS